MRKVWNTIAKMKKIAFKIVCYSLISNIYISHPVNSNRMKWAEKNMINRVIICGWEQHNFRNFYYLISIIEIFLRRKSSQY